jgi:DNA-binding beta-propeller fold protein YncE
LRKTTTNFGENILKNNRLFVFVIIAMTLFLLSNSDAFGLESGDSYLVWNPGYGIKYHVTDSYDNLDCNIWGVVQCNDSDSFIITLNKNGLSDSYWSESTLGGQKAQIVDGKELIIFNSGCPIGNQAHFYLKFCLPTTFADGDTWTTHDSSYSVAMVGSQTVNGITFDNCIRIDITTTGENASEYMKGNGFFLLSRNVGIIKFEFTRNGEGYSGSMVQYGYLEQAISPLFNLTGNIVDYDGNPLSDILVQLSGCHNCISCRTGVDGSFLISAYGPDIILQTGYDSNGDSQFDSFESGQYEIKKVSDINSDVNNIEIILSAPQNYAPIKEWGGRGGAEGLFNYPTGIAVDRNGYIYVADTLNNRIQRFRADGSFDCVWRESFRSPLGIITDSQGNIYIAGGNTGNVQKFSSSGSLIRSWQGLGSPCGIALDPSERFIYVSEERDDTIAEIDMATDTIKRFGETGTANGQFDHPSGVATDTNGNIYVVDIGNSRIQIFGHDLVYQDQINLVNNYQPNKSWPIIYDIKIAATGAVYFSNMHNDSIDIYENGNFSHQIGTTGDVPGKFNEPNGLAFDANGNLYIADKNNYRFQKLDQNGNFLMAVGSYGGDGPGHYNMPLDCEFYEDNSGEYLYILDFWNSRVQTCDTQGNFITMWGTRGSDPGEFRNPEALAIDTLHKRVYVSDSGNNRIQKFDLNGNYLDQWGSYGTGNGQFSRLTGIAINAPAGFIYAADCDNPRIQKFDLNGNYLDQWGNAGTENGQFISPRGVAVDCNGNVYVSDESAGGEPIRIQKFDADGNFLLSFSLPESATVSTGVPRLYDIEFDKFGNLFVCCTRGEKMVHKFHENQSHQMVHLASFGKNDFRSPNGLAVDSQGLVYVCDSSIDKVFKYMKTGSLFAGLNYICPEDKTGLGIRYQMTDTYEGSDSSIWAVTQSSDNEKFLLTLTGETGGSYFRDSALTGRKSRVINGRELIFYQSGCPVGNQANFYMMFSLPAHFRHGDTWQIGNRQYSVEILGSVIVNETRFDDCIKISFDTTADPPGYLNGTGSFIVARGIGIVSLDFTRKTGNYLDSKVTFQYMDHKEFALNSLSGTVTDRNNHPISNILVQLSNCDGSHSDRTDTNGNFSLTAYGPEIVLRAGYDNDNNNTFDFFGPGYFSEQKIEHIENDISEIIITGFEPFNEIPLPSITIVSPSTGETISGTVSIEVSCDPETTSHVEFYIDGIKVGSYYNKEYTYIWDTNNISDGTHSIKVIQYDKLAKTATDTITVTVDNSHDSLKLNIISPNGGELWLTGHNQEIIWSTSGIDGSLKIELSTDDGQSYTEIATTEVANKTFSWLIPDTPSGRCRVRITALETEINDTSLEAFSIYTCSPPWKVKTGTEYNMIVQGTVFKDGTPIDSNGYFLGSFGPGGLNDCRSISEIDCVNGTYYATIVGNITGETITFRLYECSTGNIYTINESILFKQNGYLNGILLQIAGDTPALQEISLVEGWNWVSFNRIPDNTSLDAVFASILDKIEQVKGQYRATVKIGNEWRGDLRDMREEIGAGKMFKIKVSTDCVLQVTGNTIAPNSSINLVERWNWAAYLPRISYDLNTALTSILPVLYQVKEQGRSAILENDGSFTGDLNNMIPGRGYVINVDQSSVLNYPSSTRVSNSITLVRENEYLEGTSLPTPIEGNEFNMVTMGTLRSTGQIAGNKLELYGFGTGGSSDCRCISSVKTDGNFFFTVRGDSEDEGNAIELRLYNTVTGEVGLLSQSSLVFTAGAMVRDLALETSQPVRINNTGYNNLEEAFNDAQNGDVIRMQEHTFPSSIILESNNTKSVTLKSGFNYSFSNLTKSNSTKISGKATISSGANVILDQGSLILQ